MKALLSVSKHRREAIAKITSEALVAEIEGRLAQVSTALRTKNIHLLSGGALENYLPSYRGTPYRIAESLKASSIQAELDYLSQKRSKADLKNRYGALFDLLCALPSKPEVDIDKVLRKYVAGYIFNLQEIATANPNYEYSAVVEALKQTNPEAARLAKLRAFSRTSPKEFAAEIIVFGRYGKADRLIPVSHKTNAGMGDFDLKPIVEG